MANRKRIIAVDLDGTLVHYDGWKGIHNIGPVIPEIANAMEAAQREGAEVHLFTARVSDPDDAAEAHAIINDWATKNGFTFASITAVKHKFFTEFWDDRAIQVIPNSGMFVLNEHTDDVCLNDRDDHGYSEQHKDDYRNEADKRMNDHQLMQELVQGGDPLFTPAEEEPRTPTSALDIQEGGQHYKKYAIQPIEFVVRNNVPTLESNALKYILRHGDKNKMEDLRKARHYLELMAEMYYGEKL